MRPLCQCKGSLRSLSPASCSCVLPDHPVYPIKLRCTNCGLRGDGAWPVGWRFLLVICPSCLSQRWLAGRDLPARIYRFVLGNAGRGVSSVVRSGQQQPFALQSVAERITEMAAEAEGYARDQ